MNILYLAHRIPYPPNKGDKLRAFRQLQHLASRHRVWCACFVDDAADGTHVELLSRMCEDVAAVRLNRKWAALRGLIGLVRGGTVTESYYTHPAMREVLRRWCAGQRFDAVVAFSSSMAPYALAVSARRRVLDLCDRDSRKWLQYAALAGGPRRCLYRVEGRRLARREREGLDAFDAAILITSAEAKGLARYQRRGKLHIIGNGVDVPHFDVPDGGPRTHPTIGFVGVMDYAPNVDAVRWFVAACWPGIRAAVPQAVFRIVGRSPARAVRRLASVQGIEVTGEVEDATAEVRRFDVSVAPLRIARGLQNKVLEAMACARPVVLSSGAAEGIDGRHGHEYLVADTADETVGHVVRLLGDPVERERLGLTARQFVAANHCWREELDRFEFIVTGALERSVPRDTVTPATAALALNARPVVAGT